MGFTPEVIEYLAENELISIVPQFASPTMHLMSVAISVTKGWFWTIYSTADHSSAIMASVYIEERQQLHHNSTHMVFHRFSELLTSRIFRKMHREWKGEQGCLFRCPLSLPRNIEYFIGDSEWRFWEAWAVEKTHSKLARNTHAKDDWGHKGDWWKIYECKLVF